MCDAKIWCEITYIMRQMQRMAVAKHFAAMLKEHLAKTLTEVKKTTADRAKHGETMATAAEAVQNMLTSRTAQGTDESTGDNLYLVNAVETVLARTEETMGSNSRNTQKC